MRAMVVRAHRPVGTGVLVREERAVPAPGPGEVLLRVLACGCCHTDLHVCAGELPPRPLPVVPGHEIVAEVAAAGEGVGGPGAPRPGDRVGLPWLNRTCGTCRFCRTGRENLCPAARFTGYDADGGYAGFVVAPASFVVPLPDTYADVEAAPLLCAGVIGWRAIRRAGVQPGERVGLFGFGASAHLALQVLGAWGCQVAVWSRGPHHLRLAEGLGAAWTGGYRADGPWPLERAIVFTPAGETLLEALRRLEAGGVVAIASVHLSPVPGFDHDRLLLGEREIRSVTASTRQDAADFLRFAAAVRLRVETETAPLDAAEATLERLLLGHVHGAAVLVPGPGDR